MTALITKIPLVYNQNIKDFNLDRDNNVFVYSAEQIRGVKWNSYKLLYGCKDINTDELISIIDYLEATGAKEVFDDYENYSE